MTGIAMPLPIQGGIGGNHRCINQLREADNLVKLMIAMAQGPTEVGSTPLAFLETAQDAIARINDALHSGLSGALNSLEKGAH